MSTDSDPRRGFLRNIAAGAATLGLASLPGAGRLLAEPTVTVPESEFETVLKKLSARKHKQVFDAPKFNDAMGVVWSWAYLRTSNDLGLKDADVGAFVVLRHETIPLAMNDSMWAKYKLGEVFKITDKSTNAPSVRNVVTHIRDGDMPLPDMALEKMQARGVYFGVCQLAIFVYSMHVAQAMGLKAEDVMKDWNANLLPGIVPLPSGVWAVSRAQESGLTYCFAG